MTSDLHSDQPRRDAFPAGLRGGYEFLKAENKWLRHLAQQVIDSLDAEKTPDYGVGHDRAWAAALAMLGKRPTPYEGRTVTLDQIPLAPDETQAEGEPDGR